MKIVVPEKEIKIDDLSDLIGTSDKSLTKTIGSGNTLGRGKATDKLVREMAAIDVAAGMKLKDAAEIYGISVDSASAYGSGRTTSNAEREPDKDLKETTDRVRNKIENAAVSKLMSTLDLFNPDGLESQMEVVSAAQKLAGVVEKISSKKDKNENKVEIHFYQPRSRDIKTYDTIEVG
jgi:predicted transcriptional regulator